MRRRTTKYLLGSVALGCLVAIMFVSTGPSEGYQYLILVTIVVLAFAIPPALRRVAGIWRRTERKIRRTIFARR